MVSSEDCVGGVICLLQSCLTGGVWNRTNSFQTREAILGKTACSTQTSHTTHLDDYILILVSFNVSTKLLIFVSFFTLVRFIVG